MRLLLTGATGLLGTKLARAAFERGHSLTILVRTPQQARDRLGIPCRTFRWDASTVDSVPGEALEESDAVLNLAGEPLAKGMWTAAKMRRIYDSRVAGTRALVEAIRKIPLDKRPPILISASAIGIYGDRGDEILSETSDPETAETDFLARVCTDWEQQTLGHDVEGVRAIALRLGIVLALAGGALPAMLPAFGLGLGGVIGSGRQWMGWLHIEDAIEAIFFLLEGESHAGAFNLTSPAPVTNAEFSRALGRALSKPVPFRIPAFALRLALGRKSSMLLASQRVIPQRLEAAGFRYRYAHLEPALIDICGGNKFETIQWVPKPVDEVFSFFSDASNLEKITPPWLKFRIVEKSGPQMGEGTLITYRLKLHGLPVKWRSRIDTWIPGSMFRDTQIQGPYRRWEHEHRFIPLSGGTLIKDSVKYELPFGRAGEVLAGHIVARDVGRIFSYRRKVIEEIMGG